MLLRLFTITALFSIVVIAQQSAPIPPSPGFPSCNVCGQGMKVTNEDLILNISGQPPVSCFNLQRAGAQGFIEQSTCPVLPTIAAPCGCVPATGPTLAPIVPGSMPTEQPIPFPTPAPTTGSTPSSDAAERKQRVAAVAAITAAAALVAMV